MRALLALVAVAACLPLNAQTARRPRVRAAKPAPATALKAWPIGSITVAGNQTYPAEQIVHAAGLRIGQVAGEKEFDAARDRLLATGAFESVGYRFEPSASDASKYAAVFEVKEIAQVYPFRTEELGVDERALRSYLASHEALFADKLPGTEQTIARYARLIEQFLSANGKQTKVVGRLTPDPVELTVVFRPASLPSVAEIYFRGNKVIDQVTLQRAAAGAGVGAIFTENRFRQILDHSVRPLYEAQGYLRLSFDKFETAKAKNVEGIAVTVDLTEGPVYKLGPVRVSGVPGAGEMTKMGAFKTGEVANMTEVDNGVEAILRSLRKDGFLHASARTQRNIDDRERTVAVGVIVTAGPRFTMGTLTIEGLDVATEPHIRKLWVLKPGAPFDGEYPNYFIKRLKDDQVFENPGDMKANVKLDEKALRADVNLWFGKGGELPAIGPDVERKR